MIIKKTEKIVSRNPLEFSDIGPYYLTNNSRWTKYRDNAGNFSIDDFFFKVNNSFSNKYMYEAEKSEWDI